MGFGYSIMETKYLADIPEVANKHGFPKTLTIRNEIIHLKHIFTELFTRKSVDIRNMLEYLNMDIYRYMEIMTNRIRKIHHISRGYVRDCNAILKHNHNKFFPTIQLLGGLNNIIVLDFDGVVTDKRFIEIYELCNKRCRTEICSANPTITSKWFEAKNITMPSRINAVKGKKKKIYKIIEIQKKYDNVFYVDDEKKYLDYVWVFGVKTFLWNGKKITKHSLKTI